MPVAALAHWLARRRRDDAVALFLQAMAEAHSLPPGPIRSIVAALASGGLASLDPASARQVLLELIDPDPGDLVSPSDIVRAAIGTVLYLDATGRPDDRSEILSRTLFLPGAPRLVDVFAPEVDTDVSLLPGTHLELLDRMRTLLMQPPSTHEELRVN